MSGRADDNRSEIRVVELGDGIAAIELVGDHGFQDARNIRAALSAAARGHACVVLDLSPATFIDSSVIREIVVASRSAKHDRRRFYVQAPAGRPITRRLRLMHLDRLMPVCHSRVEALAAP